jgi:hypothetical protein
MRDITALIRIHQFFFISEAGTACRIPDFAQLKKVYALGDLIAELQRVFAFARESQDRRELIILQSLAYQYLFAYLYYEQNTLEEILEASVTYVRKYEKATAPRWWDFLSNVRMPENATKAYETNKACIPVMEQARPVIQFMISRCGNYDHFAKPIRDTMRHFDQLLCLLGTSAPAVIFDLLDYLDSQVEAKRRSLWSKQ